MLYFSLHMYRAEKKVELYKRFSICLFLSCSEEMEMLSYWKEDAVAGPSNRQEGGLDAVAGPSNRRNCENVVAGPSNRQEGGLDAVAGPSNRRNGENVVAGPSNRQEGGL